MAFEEEENTSWGGGSGSNSEAEGPQIEAHNTGKGQNRRAATLQKDAEEEDLERLVFGSKASFREQLFKQTTTEDTGSALQELALEDAAAGRPTDVEDLDDSALFF